MSGRWLTDPITTGGPARESLRPLWKADEQGRHKGNAEHCSRTQACRFWSCAGDRVRNAGIAPDQVAVGIGSIVDPRGLEIQQGCALNLSESR
jgi:hypothetical protein